jgi:hypothetical protein
MNFVLIPPEPEALLMWEVERLPLWSCHILTRSYVQGPYNFPSSKNIFNNLAG